MVTSDEPVITLDHGIVRWVSVYLANIRALGLSESDAHVSDLDRRCAVFDDLFILLIFTMHVTY